MKKLSEVKTTYTLDEHLKFNIALFTRSKILILDIIIAALLIIPAIATKQWYIVTIAILLPLTSLLSVYLKAKGIYKSNKASQNMDINIEFYNDYIIQKTDMGSYKVENDKIFKIIETKSHFYIMISKNQGIAIPKDKISKEIEEYIKKLNK